MPDNMNCSGLFELKKLPWGKGWMSRGTSAVFAGKAIVFFACLIRKAPLGPQDLRRFEFGLRGKLLLLEESLAL